MKRVLSIFAILIFTFLFLVFGLISIAYLAQDAVVKMALKQVSTSIKAPIEFERVSLSLIHSFPLATLEFQGLKMGAPMDSITQEPHAALDTLVSIDHFYVSVLLLPLFENDIEVKRIEVSDAFVRYEVDENGVSNFDFLLSPSSTSSSDSASSLVLNIEEMLFKNISIEYADRTLGAHTNLFIKQLDTKGHYLNNVFEGKVAGDVTFTNNAYNGTNVYVMEEALVHLDLDYVNTNLHINHLDILTNGAHVAMQGHVLMKDTLNVDLAIQARELQLNELVKYVPIDILQTYGIKGVDGTVKLDAVVKGDVSASLMPSVTINADVSNGKLVMQDYPSFKNIMFSGVLSNGALRNNFSSHVKISKFYAETDSSTLDLKGVISNIDQLKYNVSGDLALNLIDISPFLSNTPIQLLDGKLVLKMSTSGRLPKVMDATFADYVLSNSQIDLNLLGVNLQTDSLRMDSCSAQINYKAQRLQIAGLSVSLPTYNVNLKKSSLEAVLTGSVSDYKQMGVELTSFRLQADNWFTTGTATVNQLSQLRFNIASYINLNLKDVKQWLPKDMVTQMSGAVTLRFTTHGALNLDSINTNDITQIVFENSLIAANLNDVTVATPDTMYQINNLSAKVNIGDNKIHINKADGTYRGIRFAVDSTTISNLYYSVLKNQPQKLLVDGVFNLGKLDYTMLGFFMPTQTNELPPEQASKSVPSAKTNYTFRIRGRLGIESITYNKVFLDNISTLFSLTDSTYKADELRFNAFKGTMNSAVRYDIKNNNKSEFLMRNKVDGMDIKQLLSDFNDFDQTEITHKQLSGLLTTSLYSRVVLKNGQVVNDLINMKGDLKLVNGGLYNYKRATSLSSMSGIKDLNNIQFKTLDSKLFILQNAVYMPETNILSNAMDVSVFGKQTFGDDYQYHLGINLREVLMGKSNRKNEKQDKLDNVNKVKDLSGQQFFVVKRIKGKEENAIDNKNDRALMTTKIRTQEALLKVVFNPILFNFDTGVSNTIFLPAPKPNPIDSLYEK